jgi:putative endonuclease
VDQGARLEIEYPANPGIVGSNPTLSARPEGRLVMAVTVYVLRSKRSGKRYVGITNDLNPRLREHTSRNTKAGQLVADAEVIYTGQLPDHAAARARERFLKSGQGREWLDELERVSWPACGG